MDNEPQKEYHTYILTEWICRIKKTKSELPPLKCGCMLMEKANKLTISGKAEMKAFFQDWKAGKHKNVSYDDMHLIRIHMRLQFMIDLMKSYLVQIASDSPPDYLSEVRMNDTQPEAAFWETCKSLMFDCWDVRGGEWILAATTNPLVARHCLALVFDSETMSKYVTPIIEDTLKLKEDY